jgi:hypothetical protein
MADTPRRRAADRGWKVLLRENAYRDVWLLAITIVLLFAVVSIQNQRWDRTLDACEANNQRYAQTKLKLDELIAKAREAGPPARAEASRKGTLALISTLAPPHFDKLGHSTCKVVADRAVNRWP